MQPPVAKKTKKRKQVPTQTQEAVAAARTASHSPSRASPAPSTSRSAPKKPYFKPIPPKKATAYDLFGTDSEDDEKEDVAVPGKAPIQLTSYLTRRLANGHSRQTYEHKPGTHYIDLKVYRCDEIKNVQPINRWRQAIVTVKNQTSENTDAWQHLTNFIMATRKEFVKCPPTFVSNYY